MERRNELKAKARELEYGDRPEEALAAYLQLLDRSDHPSAALWARAGEMQVRLGMLEEAKESLARSIAGFRDAGQLNNALAVGRILAEARLDTPDMQLELGQIALTQGYRPLAQEAIAAFARSTAEAGRAEAAIEPIAAFLRRFPDERDLWRDWADELLALGREEDALAGLRAIAAAAAESGADSAAATIVAELQRLRPQPKAPDDETAPVEMAPAFGEDGDDLPLLETAPREEEEHETQDFAPLEGLEATHVGWESSEPLTSDAAEPLPLLDLSPEQGLEPTTPALEESEPAEDVSSDALPLLDSSAGLGEPVDGQVDERNNAAFEVRGAVTDLLQLTSREVDPAEDPSTHYDLGVAFKGMGLNDEAIAHLAAALERGHDPIATLEVLGEVLVSGGHYGMAGRLLSGLVEDEDASPELVGVRYWLARSAEELGRDDSARNQYQRILESDPAFRDVPDRLRRIQTGF